MAAHHQVPPVSEGDKEGHQRAEEHGEESPLSDPRRHPLPPRQLGPAQRSR